MNARPFAVAVLLSLLAACASMPPPQMQRADRLPGAQAGSDGIRNERLPESLGNRGPQPVIRRGSASPLNQAAASAPPPSLSSSGQARFNFEGESLHAVIKAILGDMLGQSYSIAPGVQGTVTMATQQPVGAAGALSLLEGVLAQNNARMVYTDGRYNIVPADQALASGVVPRTGSPRWGAGSSAGGAAALRVGGGDGEDPEAVRARERHRQRGRRAQPDHHRRDPCGT